MARSIRHARPDDAAELHDILTSPLVVRGTMRLPYMSSETTVVRLAHDPNRLQLVLEESDQITGFAELLLHTDIPRASHAAELNMVVVHQDHLRAGVARSLIEALIEMCDTFLGIHRLELTVWQDNSGAIALYESLGFSKEGVMRDYVRSETGFNDAVKMARLRENVIIGVV